MGWGRGRNSDGREVGYSVEADCDFPGCHFKINRGLGYACGQRHADMEGGGCAYYFCSRHSRWSDNVVHNLKTHVAHVRRDRHAQAVELSWFRYGLVSAEEMQSRGLIWPFVPKEYHPRFGEPLPVPLSSIRYRSAA